MELRPEKVAIIDKIAEKDRNDIKLFKTGTLEGVKDVFIPLLGLNTFEEIKAKNPLVSNQRHEFNVKEVQYLVTLVIENINKELESRQQKEENGNN